MAEKDVYVVDDEDDSDWDDAFNFVPNVPTTLSSVSMDKSPEIESSTITKDLEIPYNTNEVLETSKSNLFEKYLPDDDMNSGTHLEKQEIIQEVATFLEKNATDSPTVATDLSSLPSRQEILPSTMNSLPTISTSLLSKDNQKNSILNEDKKTPKEEVKEEINDKPIIERSLPETKEDMYLCLKKELEQDTIDTDYIKRVLHKYMYIPSDLRTLLWPILLNVDLSMIESLKDRTTWNLNEDDYIQYNHYYIKEKINSLSMNDKDSIINYIQWITDGYMTLTNNSFTPYLLNLCLLMHIATFNKETALCCILRLLSNTYIDGKHTCIYSNTDSYAAMNMHHLFSLLVKYHSPILSSYLSTLNSTWYNPTYQFNDYKPPEFTTIQKPLETENKEEEKPDGVIPLFASLPSSTIVVPHEPLPTIPYGYINTDYLYRGYLFTNIDIDGLNSDCSLYFLDYMIIEGNCSLYIFVYLAMLIENEDKIISINAENMEIYLNNIYTNYKTIDQFTHILSYALSLRSLTPLTVLPVIISLFSQTCTDVSSTIQGSYDIWYKRLEYLYRYSNPSKLSRISSLLKQWNGHEEDFEYAVLKNYHICRVLSRDIYYAPNIMATNNIKHCIGLDISATEIGEKVIFKNITRDIDSLYLIIDLRDEEACNYGYLANSLPIESRIWYKDLQIEGYINSLDKIKNKKHIILMHWGSPISERKEKETQDLLVAYKKLLNSGFTNVSICTDGYYGIHEYIRKHQQIEYILQHNKEHCEVCLCYRFDDMMNIAKEKTENFINIASTSVSSFANTSVTAIKKSLPTEEQAKKGMHIVSQKASSIFNSAIQWSKETTQKIKQDYEQKAAENRRMSDISTQSMESSTVPSTTFTIEEEEEENQANQDEINESNTSVDSTNDLIYLSLYEGSKFIVQNDLIDTNKYIKHNGSLYQVKQLTSLFTTVDNDKLYYYLLFGSRIMLLTSDPNSLGKAIVIMNWSISDVTRLTFKKGDKNVVTLYIHINGQEASEVLRGSIPESTEFATHLQQMIQKIEK